MLDLPVFQDRMFLPVVTWNKKVNDFVHPFGSVMVVGPKLLAENSKDSAHTAPL